MNNGTNDQVSDNRTEQDRKVLAAFWALQPRGGKPSDPKPAWRFPWLTGTRDSRQ